MAEYVHAMPPSDTRTGRTGRDYVNPSARCGGMGRVALFVDDVTCPTCLELMAAEATRAILRTGIERAERKVGTVVLDLSVWEGRGDWSALPAEQRTEAGRRGLERLTEAIAALEAERTRLREALGVDDDQTDTEACPMLPTPTDARADWTCDTGASLIAQATGPSAGRLPRLHAVIYVCEAHRTDAETRIAAAGYRPDVEAAPPEHRSDPWPCGHITAYEAAAARALTADAAAAGAE